jgi:hypothetical protein
VDSCIKGWCLKLMHVKYIQIQVHWVNVWSLKYLFDAFVAGSHFRGAENCERSPDA